MTQRAEAMVNAYLHQLDQAMADLSPDVAKDVSSQVGEHIAAALAAIPNPSESDVKKILAEVGSPMSIANAASAEFPSKHRVSLRTLSFWAYTLWFGTIWGFNPATFSSLEPGLMLLTYGMAVAGSSLVVIKNRRINDKRLRQRMMLSDAAVAGVALAIDLLLPASLGMLRGPILLALFVGYFYKIRHVYQAA